MKRTERVGAITKILTDSPCKLFPLQFFCDLFDTAKSSVSEDISIASSSVVSTGTGYIETVAGAKGGVRFVPDISDEDLIIIQNELCDKLRDHSRILAGDFLYTSDIFFDATFTDRLASIFVRKFKNSGADYVATVETKGIPLAASTARKLNIPLVVIRREAKVSEGSTVSINYFSGSYDRVQKMSLSKRAVTPGAKALVIDDFMRGGGSSQGIRDILSEFDVSVCGTGIAIAAIEPEKKRIEEYSSIVYLGEVSQEAQFVRVEPNYQMF